MGNMPSRGTFGLLAALAIACGGDDGREQDASAGPGSGLTVGGSTSGDDGSEGAQPRRMFFGGGMLKRQD